jgi:hypothetical protein
MVTSRTFDLFEGDRPILLLFAPAEDDDRLDGQLLCVNDLKEEFVTRDVVLYMVVETGESTVGGEKLSRVDADSLRLRFGVGAGDFLAVLVARDGYEAMRWDAPASPDELIRAIDASMAAARPQETGPEQRERGA